MHGNKESASPESTDTTRFDLFGVGRSTTWPAWRAGRKRVMTLDDVMGSAAEEPLKDEVVRPQVIDLHMLQKHGRTIIGCDEQAAAMDVDVVLHQVLEPVDTA